MKRIIIVFIVLLFTKNNVLGQIIQFDSVKVYTNTYYGTELHLNQNNLLYGGDSVLITDIKMTEQFFIKLSAMKGKSTLSKLKKIRKDFTSTSINVRAVFVFYKKSERIIIGISPQPLMFINNIVFEKRDIKLEHIVKPSTQLYKNLFPTKEETINKN
jgi:hypothetical protein